jgi:hypothetical protein
MLDFDHNKPLLLSLYHDQFPDPFLPLLNSDDAGVYFGALLDFVNSVAVTMGLRKYHVCTADIQPQNIHHTY